MKKNIRTGWGFQFGWPAFLVLVLSNGAFAQSPQATSAAPLVSRDDLVREGDCYFTFEKQTVGEIPEHWERVTGDGAWRITDEHSATTVNGFQFFRPNHSQQETSVCIVAPDHVEYSDVDMSAHIRLGKVMPGTDAGVVWHYQDKDNHYSAAYSKNGIVNVYRTEAGKTERLVSVSSSVGSDESRWIRLRVICLKDDISVFLNGGRLLSLRENSKFETGKVGLTSSASDVVFDRFRLRTAEAPYKTSVVPKR